MQVPEEIEDPEGYCMLKIEKIDAVHGSLRQSVQMGHMKPDRAEALKKKFEDLREALRMKFATQRKLAGEKSELEFEKQQQEAKLEKYKKEARTGKETLAILGEDAEEAAAQAAMALCTSCHFFLICEYTHILSLSALICVREANQTDMCSKLTPL